MVRRDYIVFNYIIVLIDLFNCFNCTKELIKKKLVKLFMIYSLKISIVNEISSRV